nr:alpha/beta hydrolase [Candidatus Sigynarchaeota archaeon]
MNDQSHTPLLIWGDAIPSTNVGLAIKESGWRARKGLRIKALEIPSIDPYTIASDKPRPAMIVAPGGGYAGRAPHEGAPIAMWLNSMGIPSFVLNYRVYPFFFPVPFLDAQRAVRYLRHYAARFNIDRDSIGMLGFSAGGHLTSMVGTLQRRDWFPEGYHDDAIDSEPDALACMVLCYPLINMDANAHIGCRAKFLGRHPDPGLLPLLSTEQQVNKATPPAFIWTTRDDQALPLVHSTSFSDALARYGIDHELHVFEHGAHGLGLAENDPDVHQWTTRCHDWLSRIGFA